jgi:hypothetical protein
MRSAKSSNGRVTWVCDQGRLREHSPESSVFTLTATDTLILATLLVASYEEIKTAAERELRGFSHTDDAYRSLRYRENQKRDAIAQEGATGGSGVDIG